MYKRMIIHSAVGFISFWLLYKKLWLALAGMVLFLAYSLINRNNAEKERISRNRGGFLDFLICLEPLLKTTGTFPGAFETAAADYAKFHGNDPVSNQLQAAVRGFRMNLPTNEVLSLFSERMDIDEARSFSDSIAVCESTGGNTVEITGRTIDLLIRKIRVIRDIESSLSGRIFEQRIITIMPFALLLIFSNTAGSYLEPLYDGIKGAMIMTAAGLIFLLQWLIGRRIMNIGV